jgi:hypothetical protein
LFGNSIELELGFHEEEFCYGYGPFDRFENRAGLCWRLIARSGSTCTLHGGA